MESRELFEIYSVFKVLLSCKASPKAIPPLLPRELKDNSKCVND
jgi:nitrous oxide reductase accessory protein NosL